MNMPIAVMKNAMVDSAKTSSAMYLTSHVSVMSNIMRNARGDVPKVPVLSVPAALLFSEIATLKLAAAV
jgi:hypothetical protein